MNTEFNELHAVRLNGARESIENSDLLLFRNHSLITIGGRGEHSHAAKVAWWGDELFCMEVREWHGGRAVTLASQVQRFPGRIDVYQANADNRWPEYDREGAVSFMRRMCGSPYGYWGLVHAAMLHLPVIRLFTHANVNDQSENSPAPFCSQACSEADRLGGGVDPVPHLADQLTEPADLARSPFYRYRFTLIP